MTLLPAKLKAAGYRTAYRGKWHYGFSKPSYLPVARGFEDAAGYLQGACDHEDESTGCAVDSWRSNANGSYNGPDRRNNTGYDSFRHAADMVDIIRRQAVDNRPLFLYAALHVAHQPLEAPQSFVAPYTANASTRGWCKSKKTIAAMASVADNVTAQLVNALKASPQTPNNMWNNTVLVFSSDNGGDSSCSSNHPLRGRKRTFFDGGCRVVAFLNSPLLPASSAAREETAFFHISDWYATFMHLGAVTTNPTDAGPGRFSVDGRNMWPYLMQGGSGNGSSNGSRGKGATAPAPATATATATAEGPPRSLPPAFNNKANVMVLGWNYSTLRIGGAAYDNGSGALIEVSTGYKLIVGSQHSCGDALNWDAPDYPCGQKTAAGPDCIPHCLYNVLADPNERKELSGTDGDVRPRRIEDANALARLLKAYAAVGAEDGMPNRIDVDWNEQGTPYDPNACKAARASGYWQPWLV